MGRRHQRRTLPRGTMNFTALVDVAIGMTLVYVGVSILVTIMSEYISNFANLRGRQLEQSLKTLFNQSALKEQFVPLREALESARSYVDPKVLAQVVIAALQEPGEAPAGEPTPGALAKSLLAKVDKLPESQLKMALQTIARSTENATEKIVLEVSDTIDRSLKVLGESYKRWLSVITFGLGLLVAVLGNIDTVALVSTLYKDKELRDELVVVADRFVKETKPELVQICVKPESKDKEECKAVIALGRAIKDRSGTLGKLPIGWPHGLFQSSPPTPGESPKSPGERRWAVVFQFCGWLLTAFAAALGAPFWFDMLSRISNVRQVVARPEPESKKPAVSAA